MICIAPVNGWYKVQLWGASGGGAKSIHAGEHGGRGAYVSGEIYLTVGTNLKVFVGGQGRLKSGGYNGGGGSLEGYGGGGATDIRTVSGNCPQVMKVY